MAFIIPDPWNQLQAKASVALAETKAGDAAAFLTGCRDFTNAEPPGP